eukprot:CAMPEP_0117744202 /NCGR_PEP_ID=MMETSP0947-20121206/6613_1 /TAXON_ID=44440 /ORGANISM="Chattonella subsalsa, Strain CCMP2191" /LENGTH=437 /DNA_ID=CAMNT_0005561095 /DNA_START=341 /DNA_END=1651 /DNA_ORIENTATION=-
MISFSPDRSPSSSYGFLSPAKLIKPRIRSVDNLTCRSSSKPQIKGPLTFSPPEKEKATEKTQAGEFKPRTLSMEEGAEGWPVALSMDMVGKPTCPYRSISGSTVETPWTLAVKRMKDAETVTDVLRSLEEINDVLNIYDAESIKCCKEDFSRVVREKRADGWYVFTTEVEQSINQLLVKYFRNCELDRLPEAVLYRTLGLLPLEEHWAVASTCQTWRQCADSDILWRPLFEQRFGAVEAAASSSPKHGGEGSSSEGPRVRVLSNAQEEDFCRNEKGHLVLAVTYKELYRRRLWDPHVGDRVEVSWKGKFRLEAQEVYNGQAWWAAEVVEKRLADDAESSALDEERKEAKDEEESGLKEYQYKIHYPGWDSRWDEWVPRDRLRWSMAYNPTEIINVNDYVEVWCTGTNVPGAWLEAQVKQVKDDEYFVGKMLSSGPLW